MLHDDSRTVNQESEKFFVDRSRLIIYHRAMKTYDLQGAQEIADFLGVARATIQRWKKSNPRFMRACRIVATVTDSRGRKRNIIATTKNAMTPFRQQKSKR